MKFKVETDDYLEAQLLAKAKDYHFVIWEFDQYLRNKIKYDEDSPTEIIDEIHRAFLNILSDNKIDIELLP